MAPESQRALPFMRKSAPLASLLNGENRGSRYQCPAECPHNPFAPGNYTQLLELVDLVDPKCMARLKSEEGEGSAFARERNRATRDQSITATQAC